jgi:hypothetical protein
MWQLVQALNFYGRFKLQAEESADKVEKKKRNGVELHCIEIRSGSNFVRELCFHDKPVQLVSEHYLPSDRWYEFSNYLSIRKKLFPGHINIFEGKSFVAEFSVSKVEETDSIPTGTFEQPVRAEWRPWCASPDAGGDPLTPIYSLRAKTRGETTLYGSLGTDGRWRVNILESGGSSHDTEVLEAVKKERWSPSSCGGVPIVIETVFRR